MVRVVESALVDNSGDCWSEYQSIAATVAALVCIWAIVIPRDLKGPEEMV